MKTVQKASAHHWDKKIIRYRLHCEKKTGALHALALILKPFPQEAVQCDYAAQSCHSEAMSAIALLVPSEKCHIWAFFTPQKSNLE